VLKKIPFIVFISVILGVVKPGLISVMLGFGTIKVLEYSIMTAASEMIYMPMGHDVRYLGKELIKFFGHKLGKSAASLVLSACVAKFEPSLSTQSVWGAVFTLCWGLTMIQLARYLTERDHFDNLESNKSIIGNLASSNDNNKNDVVYDTTSDESNDSVDLKDSSFSSELLNSSSSQSLNSLESCCEGESNSDDGYDDETIEYSAKPISIDFPDDDVDKDDFNSSKLIKQVIACEFLDDENGEIFSQSIPIISDGFDSCGLINRNVNKNDDILLGKCVEVKKKHKLSKSNSSKPIMLRVGSTHISLSSLQKSKKHDPK
jgi:hypothetical protein